MTDEEASERMQKFFEKASKNCTCNFNQSLFRAVLAEYVGLRFEIHHRRKMNQVPYTLFNRIHGVRHRLEALAPCRECIIKYNPTGRIGNKVWNPQRTRAYKECLQ